MGEGLIKKNSMLIYLTKQINLCSYKINILWKEKVKEKENYENLKTQWYLEIIYEL